VETANGARKGTVEDEKGVDAAKLKVNGAAEEIVARTGVFLKLKEPPLVEPKERTVEVKMEKLVVTMEATDEMVEGEIEMGHRDGPAEVMRAGVVGLKVA